MKSANINGVINVYKEKGYTSHDVVAKMRGILKTKKIGHTGTLDPDAEGVLPICIGNATKLCDMLTDTTKKYEAELILGICTDTQDISGKILQEKDNVEDIDEKSIVDIINGFRGDYPQIPPMYSALKVNGRKLYDYARAGIEVERKPRMVKILSIEIVNIALPKIQIRVECSKGTYIRTLCNDIGEKLGCGGCMGKLLRTKTGPFILENSIKLGDIQKICNEEKFEASKILIPTEMVLKEYRSISIKTEFTRFAYNGNILYENMIDKQKETSYSDADSENSEKSEEMFRLYDKDKFIGIYRYLPDKEIYKPWKMFLG